jgi:hypothetical protein
MILACESVFISFDSHDIAKYYELFDGGDIIQAVDVVSFAGIRYSAWFHFLVGRECGALGRNSVQILGGATSRLRHVI